MQELNDLFDYGYSIYQDSRFFKFSLDSVLLAEFVNIKKNKYNVLDLCSGNAPIPMILNKKYDGILNIKAFELQADIYNLGVKSIKYNNINSIDYICDDIKNIKNYNYNKFDVITCNPPYFLVSSKKILNDNDVKAIQRHEIKIKLEEIVKISSELIENKGYFYMVHRPERMIEIINLLNKYNFGIKRLEFVYNNEKSDCILILIEAQFNGKNYLKIGKPLYLDRYSSYQGIFKEVK